MPSLCLSHVNYTFKKRTRILQWKRESHSSPTTISLDASLSQTSNNVKNSSLSISIMTIRRPGEISLWILPKFRLPEFTQKARRGAKHSTHVVISIVRHWVSREEDKMESQKERHPTLTSDLHVCIDVCTHTHLCTYSWCIQEWQEMLKNVPQSMHCQGSNILWFLLLLASGFKELVTGKKNI